ncbi:DUF4430 domain-containing protein [Miltoncostaea marina]|uniref:DUF4430 domain-containing protein n=1 Tax=Miltoncostaea marina TaxID=2843215 RepID=UPI001C3E340F|nr:DUF4430 domain-containing protein [Miltoncostaea marina]
MRRRPCGALAPVLMALLALAALAALAAGCERRSQDAPAAEAPAATLVATAGYGERELLSTRVAPGQSVMRALRGATEVRTAYAGAFVDSMLGLRSDAAAEEDWFFFVNGVAGATSAEQVPLGDGDAVWWDHRDWGSLQNAFAVVGQWPAPLALPGGRGPAVAADPPLRAALEAAGARLTDVSSPWRAVVGASDALARRDPAWRRALADPDGAGIGVAVEGGANGPRPGGAPREPVPGARALIAAVPTDPADPQAGVAVVVAGLDDAAARAAARALADDPAIVRGRYALTLDGEGRPLRAAGRAGP